MSQIVEVKMIMAKEAFAEKEESKKEIALIKEKMAIALQNERAMQKEVELFKSAKIDLEKEVAFLKTQNTNFEKEISDLKTQLSKTTPWDSNALNSLCDMNTLTIPNPSNSLFSPSQPLLSHSMSSQQLKLLSQSQLFPLSTSLGALDVGEEEGLPFGEGKGVAKVEFEPSPKPKPLPLPKPRAFPRTASTGEIKQRLIKPNDG